MSDESPSFLSFASKIPGKIFASRRRAPLAKNKRAWIDLRLWRNDPAGGSQGSSSDREQVGCEDVISFFNGANNVSITGDPSFHVSGHTYHQHHYHHYYYPPPSVPRLGLISGVTFVDMTGKEYSVSMDHAVSYKVFCKAVELLFHGQSYEAEMQRYNLEWQAFELLICQRTEMIEVHDESWASHVEAGTRIVMMPILNGFQWYICPHCDTWITLDLEQPSAECQHCKQGFKPADDEARWLRPCEEPTYRAEAVKIVKASMRKRRLAVMSGEPVFTAAQIQGWKEDALKLKQQKRQSTSTLVLP